MAWLFTRVYPDQVSADNVYADLQNYPASYWGPLPEPFHDIAWAMCCCPSGHLGTLSRKIHQVSNEGIISPSYVCPNNGCDFHEYVELAGWKDVC